MIYYTMSAREGLEPQKTKTNKRSKEMFKVGDIVRTKNDGLTWRISAIGRMVELWAHKQGYWYKPGWWVPSEGMTVVPIEEIEHI